MQIHLGARLHAKINDGAPLQKLQSDDLVVHQRRQRDRLARGIAQGRHLLTRSTQDVEALAQRLAQHQQLDARFVAAGFFVLAGKAMFDQRLDVPVDRGLGRVEDLRQLRQTHGLAAGHQVFENIKRKIDRARRSFGTR